MSKNETYSIGVDVGSTSSEVVLINDQREIIYLGKDFTGVNMLDIGRKLITECLIKTGVKLSQVISFTATGYGRKLVKFSELEKIEKTEISCYGRGAGFLNPEIRTIIDMGGQDSKVISINKKGKVLNFAMNDKCAAGTGRFLEMIANHFRISLEESGRLALRSTQAVKMSNICAVFAESEIISLVSQGVKLEDIIQAVQKSIAKRVVGMAQRVGIENKIMFCGGVALNEGMVKNLEDQLKAPLLLPDKAEYVGAIGAALYGL